MRSEDPGSGVLPDGTGIVDIRVLFTGWLTSSRAWHRTVQLVWDSPAGSEASGIVAVILREQTGGGLTWGLVDMHIVHAGGWRALATGNSDYTRGVTIPTHGRLIIGVRVHERQHAISRLPRATDNSRFW